MQLRGECGIIMKSDDGFGTVISIIYCAIISLACSFVVIALHTYDKSIKIKQNNYQTSELLNLAIMRASSKLLEVGQMRSLTVKVEAGALGQVEVKAEPESIKWPIRYLGREEVLVKIAGGATDDNLLLLSKEYRGGAKQFYYSDCIRSLFSEVGKRQITDAQSRGQAGVMAGGSGLEGSVWRLRAVSKGRLQEQLLRFTGDSHRFIAIIRREDYALATSPDCPLDIGYLYENKIS